MATDEAFLNQAKSYVEKAREAGVSPVAMARLIEMKYGMYLQEKQEKADQAERDRQYGLQERKFALQEQQAQRDQYGTPDMYTDQSGKTWQFNSQTGQWDPFSPVDPAEEFDTGYDEIQSSQIDQPAPQYGPSVPSGFEFEQPEAQKEISVSERMESLESGGIKQFLPQWMQDAPVQHIPEIVKAVPDVAKKAVRGLYEMTPFKYGQNILEGIYGR